MEDRKDVFKRLRHRVEDNFKQDFKDIRWETVGCIYLNYDKEQQRDLLAIDFPLAKNWADFLEKPSNYQLSNNSSPLIYLVDVSVILNMLTADLKLSILCTCKSNLHYFNQLVQC
jgi:hypothetical protein